jgi:hypothetical protein
MKRIKHILIFMIMIAALVLPASAAAKSLDRPHYNDRVIVGSTFTLREGEILDGNIVVVGGVVTLEVNSLVNGDVVAIGSNVTVAGEIAHSLVAVGGVLSLKETAVVGGDVVAPASVFQKEDGASIAGQIITASGPVRLQGVEVPDIPAVPEAPAVPEVPESPSVPRVPDVPFSTQVSYAFSPLIDAMWFMFQIFSISAVAIVLILFVPTQAKRTANAISGFPVLSGGMGLLTLVVSVFLLVFLSITIILIPVSALLFIVLCLGLFFGWIAMGQEIGRRIGEAFGQDWSNPVQAGVGTFALTFVVSSFNFVFWDVVGWMVGITVAGVGLGAVLLTRFGTRDYIPAATSPGGAVAPQPMPETEVDPKPKAARKASTKKTASTKTAAKAATKTPKKKSPPRKSSTKAKRPDEEN